MKQLENDSLNYRTYPLHGQSFIQQIDVPLNVSGLYLKSHQGYLVELIERISLLQDGLRFVDSDFAFYLDYIRNTKPDFLVNQTTLQIPLFKGTHVSNIELTGKKDANICVYFERSAK